MFSFDLNGSLPLKMIAFVVFSIGIVGVAPVAATLLEAFQRRALWSWGLGQAAPVPVPAEPAAARSWLSALTRRNVKIEPAKAHRSGERVQNTEG